MSLDAENLETTKYVYVILTQTSTRFATTIRKVMRRKYNHASISFSSDYKEVYAFGRYRHTTPILAGLVHEYPERMSLRKKSEVPCLIFKVPVTQEAFQEGLDKIAEITNDSEGYMYNLFSVLTYPIFKGFRTYKAFSCSEFVAYMLKEMDVDLGEDNAYKITPWELSARLDEYKCYDGDILPLIEDSLHDEIEYFSKINFFSVMGKSAKVLATLVMRKCCR